MIPFWPSFVFVCVVVLFAVVTRQAHSELVPWPAKVLALLLAGLTLGLSSWYAPLGWIAWGPRLMLPWLPAIVYLTCYFYSPAIERGAAWMTANPWRFWTATAVLVAFALPHVFEVLDPRVLSALFRPDDVFPRMMTVQGDRSEYFAQSNHFMWSKGSMLLNSYEWMLHPRFRDKLLLYVVCIAVLSQAIAASVRTSVTDRHVIPELPHRRHAVPSPSSPRS